MTDKGSVNSADKAVFAQVGWPPGVSAACNSVAELHKIEDTGYKFPVNAPACGWGSALWAGTENGLRLLLVQVVLNSFYVTLWISLSGTVILYNKWILAYYGFPYPISLTMWHMAFSSVLAFFCVRMGYVPAVNMTADTYIKAIVPIGALFAGEAWLQCSVADTLLLTTMLANAPPLRRMGSMALNCIRRI